MHERESRPAGNEAAPEETTSPEHHSAVSGRLWLFPVGANKRPVIGGGNGYHDASNDPEQWKLWASTTPGFWGFGINLAKSKLAVLDLDIRDTKNGVRALDQLLEAEQTDLVPTFKVSTPSGGTHLFYDLPDSPAPGVTVDDLRSRLQQGELGGGLDYLASGYVVLYDPDGLQAALGEGLPSLPSWFREHVRTANRSFRLPGGGGGSYSSDLPTTEEILQGVEEGQRDSTLFRFACRLRREFHDDRDRVTALVLTAAAACTPPFPESQARKCVASAFKQDHTDLPIPDWAPSGWTGDDLESWFWNSRPELRTIHDFSKSRVAPPWGVLGTVLATVCANTHHELYLPKRLGARGSLNFFTALVAPSGIGKSVSISVAREVFEVRQPLARTEGDLGSGEGLVALYAYRVQEKLEDGTKRWVTKRSSYNALVITSEVDKMAAISKRQGSTYDSYLRSAWSGEGLGRVTAGQESAVMLDPHSYRLGFVLGVQPVKAGPLLGQAGGGTPQRFLWLPAQDHDASRGTATPEPILWPPQVDLMGQIPDAPADRELRVPEWLVDKVLDERVALQRGELERDELDSHRTLLQLKVAGLLALLHGSYEVTDEDWRLSEVAMAVSDRTRDGVLKLLADESRTVAKAQGARQGIRDAAAGEARAAAEDERLERLKARIGALLKDANDWLSHSALRKQSPKGSRELFNEAIDDLVDEGSVIRDEVVGGGTTGHRYRLRS